MPPRRAAVPSIHESIEDRLQRTLQENKQLKQERSDLTEKLQRVQVQFRRLQANLHLLPPEQLQQLSLQAQTAAPTADASTSLPSIGQRAKTKVPSSSQQKDDLLMQQQQQQQQQQLALTQTQLQAALQEIRRLRATVEANAAARAATTTTPTTTGDASCTSGSVELHRQLAIKSTMLAQREDECRSLREALAAAQMSATQAPPAPIHAASSSSQQVDAMLKEKQQLMQQVSAITAEKGQLMLKARLLEEDVRHAQQLAHNTAVDPEMVVQLQCDVREKANQLSVLHGRLATTQGQVEALKMECGRLMDELKGSHVAHAETKKALLVLEQERSALQIKCGLMEELEMEVQRKNTEVVRMEQELLKLVASLQSCNRETEAAVRRELATRIEELQAARDGANTERRDIERQLLAARHELEDARRKVVAMQSDVEMYRGQITKIEGEKTNLSQQLSAAEISAKELNDDEVHRAIAIAAIKKRIAHDRGEHMISAPQQGEAGAALDLFESLSWDDQWEQGKLRESLAAAALDLELAETRCQQMATKVEQSDAMAKRVCDERDTLLDENLELRRRVSHVQTVFAKQQLQAYRAAAASERGNEHGMICICIRGLRCEGPAMLCALGLESQTDATNIFFSLEGLAGFDAMISQPFHCLSDVADVFFQYEDLNPDEITLAEIQRTTFVLQLHHSVGEGSTVVAMAELPGMTLLAARELSVEEPLPLISGDGGKLGTAMVELRCARLMLPVLLGQPLSGVSAMSSAEMRAALIALRSVRSLKIQVFRAQGLAQGSHGAPQPYIFYTAQSPSGALSCVRDTVVRPNGTSFTTDPVFDASAVEHRVVVDRELAYFLAHGSIVFVVFDDRASDVRANLGMVEVPLEPLLRSPQTILHRTEPLHPQGTLSFGISWLTTA